MDKLVTEDKRARELQERLLREHRPFAAALVHAHMRRGSSQQSVFDRDTGKFVGPKERHGWESQLPDHIVVSDTDARGAPSGLWNQEEPPSSAQVEYRSWRPALDALVRSLRPEVKQVERSQRKLDVIEAAAPVVGFILAVLIARGWLVWDEDERTLMEVARDACAAELAAMTIPVDRRSDLAEGAEMLAEAVADQWITDADEEGLERVAHDYLRNREAIHRLFANQGIQVGDTGLTVEDVADRLDLPPREWERLVGQGEAPDADTRTQQVPRRGRTVAPTQAPSPGTRARQAQPLWYAMTVAAYEMVEPE